MTNDNGGYVVPKVAYVDKPKKGFIAYCARVIGHHMVNIGCYIKWNIGYEKEEIHPYDDLMRLMKETKVIK